MAGWNLDPAYSALASDFGSLEAVFALQGVHLTRDPLFFFFKQKTAYEIS